MITSYCWSLRAPSRRVPARAVTEWHRAALNKADWMSLSTSIHTCSPCGQAGLLMATSALSSGRDLARVIRANRWNAIRLGCCPHGRQRHLAVSSQRGTTIRRPATLYMWLQDAPAASGRKQQISGRRRLPIELSGLDAFGDRQPGGHFVSE